MDKVTTIKASYTVDLKLQYLRVGDIVAFQRNDMSAFVDAAQFDELKNSKSSVAFIEGFEELDYFAYLPDSFMKKFMKSQGFRTEGGLHKMDEKQRAHTSLRMQFVLFLQKVLIQKDCSFFNSMITRYGSQMKNFQCRFLCIWIISEGA